MFSLTTSSSGASRVTLQKFDAWDYRARFRGSQWRWLRATRFGSAVRGITTAPTSQLRPASRQLLHRANAFLEWHVRNGRRATIFFQPRVICATCCGFRSPALTSYSKQSTDPSRSPSVFRSARPYTVATSCPGGQDLEKKKQNQVRDHKDQSFLKSRWNADPGSYSKCRLC
jgi:hypothetical protein